MSTVSLTIQDKIALLRLDNGTTNAISSALVADLSSALSQVRCNAKGMVLLGNEKFFSIGLNLPELIHFDRTEMIDFFTLFDQITYELYTLPMPTVSAMTGHAVAGGCVLALTCDYRYAAEGKKLIGFNEATIGLPVPYLTNLMLRQLIGDRFATDMMYHGQFLSCSEAAEVGLVDKVLPLAEVEEQSIAKIDTMISLPEKAFNVQKNYRTESVCLSYAQHSSKKIDLLLDCWFEESVQEILKDASQKF